MQKAESGLLPVELTLLALELFQLARVVGADELGQGGLIRRVDAKQAVAADDGECGSEVGMVLAFPAVTAIFFGV